MADPTPILDPATRAALDQLADIALPAPVSWLPQTWGWAVLAAALLTVVTWQYSRWRRRREADRYRIEALTILATLEAQLDDDTARPHALAALPVLLKRVALAAWPRPRVAPLVGARWVEFLCAHGNGAAFPRVAAQLLDDLEYRSPAALARVTRSDARACVRAVRAWIEAHRVSA